MQADDHMHDLGSWNLCLALGIAVNLCLAFGDCGEFGAGTNMEKGGFQS